MKRFLQIIILTFFFIISCQPNQATTLLTPTDFAAETPKADIETITPAITQEIDSEITINLPEWVKRYWPDDLLVLPYKGTSDGRPSNSIFVNPDTGETFVVDLRKEYYYFYWKDYYHIIFFHGRDCNASPEFISVIDIENDTLQIFLREDYPEYTMRCYFNLDNELIRLNREYKELAVEYIDPITGEISLLTNPNDGITDLSFELSPDKNFIAVVQFKGTFDLSGIERPIYGDQISIYDVKAKEIIFQFQEERILSEVSFVDYSDIVYMRENTPCIIRILSLSKKCIHKIPNQFPDSTIILTKNNHNGVGVFGFIYFSLYEGGYCFYNIYTGDLGCPTDKFSVFKDQRITNYSLSTFDHYLLLEYDSEGCPAPYCHVFNGPKFALIDLVDNELFELGFSHDFFINTFLMPLQPNPWPQKGY